MDYSNHITNHEKDKHLTYEDYVVTELRLKDGWKPNAIAKKELNCSANNLYTSVVLGSCSTSLLHRQKKYSDNYPPFCKRISAYYGKMCESPLFTRGFTHFGSFRGKRMAPERKLRCLYIFLFHFGPLIL